MKTIRRLVTWVGFCPDCWTRVNRFPSGQAHCPWCGRRKP